jgi:hypothetical protein
MAKNLDKTRTGPNPFVPQVFGLSLTAIFAGLLILHGIYF